MKILSAGEVIDTCSFDQPVVRIGRLPRVRGEANDVVLKSGAVSGLHARMLFETGKVSIVDCSRNGTFVNGQMLSAPKQLAAGEEIKIAAFTIRWWVTSEAEESGDSSAGPLGRMPLPMPARESKQTEVSEIAGEPMALVPEESVLPEFHFEDSEPRMPGIEQEEPVIREASHRVFKPTGPLPIISQTNEPSIGDFAPPAGLADSDPCVQVIEEEEAAEVAEVVRRPPSSELAAAYRSLAEEFGAPAWGRPPSADASVLASVRDGARRLLEGSGIEDSGHWINWLAHEICGLDPIQALLDDSLVASVIVHGADPVRVLRASTWEVAARRFSCVEAVFAAVERWTSRRLVEQPIECVRGGLTIRAFGGSLAPLGPVITVQRGSSIAVSGLDDLVRSQVLSADAAELLRAALARSASILIYGSALASPSTLLQALRRSLVDEALVLIVRRVSEWSPRHALIVDGRVAAAEEVWRCVQSVAPQWLFVEEVGLADVVPLCTYARHRGGGTVVTLRAEGGDAALGRLKASLAACLGSSASACQDVVAESFDLVVGITSRANGRARVVSIAEVRRGGELAELFSWRPETSTLAKTGIEAAMLGRAGR